MHRFGTIIRRARHARGWTTEDLARRLRTAKGYVSVIENGSTNPPSPALVHKMAVALRLDPVELLLQGVVEKAPKEVRAELRRRLYGTNPAASRSGKSTLRERKGMRHLRQKLGQLKVLVETIIDDFESI